ncbi:alpha/beta hydrolase [Pseudooceanicola sp. CBS1P-1]|uniref:Alpha/beta hydrolase fold domain-containing protein n=1 Tax=Pseudooceanicola albus TaxID=2692189 RepID=A0A6L7G4T7_9RHOB|nr:MULTISPECIES: alpha/beta hydrolase [Pseudooceanicola]MBT9386211.1 alpha/beta hydrolase [Pseudooceanicola endophyticus]MXN19374.1 alpha/beta hydrolase fold domain-containing protein [Pseudooceanicola albus]
MINPEIETFLAKWNDSWAVLPAGAPITDRRLLFEYIADAMRLPQPEGIAVSTAFLAHEGRNVLMRIERATAGLPAQPCLIYMHGGAWMQGSPMTHSDITARIAAANGQTVISVDYALAPEHPFPKAIHEVIAVAHWVHANAESLGIDPTRIAIGGDSAGANLAAAACLALRGTAAAPMAQMLVYPCVHFDMSFPSYQENAEGPLIQTAGMAKTNLMYCGNEENLKHPLAAPLHADSHAGLPPAFIAVAEHDPLRDDGHAYAEKLRAESIAVQLDPGQGLIHGYLRAMEYCADARASLARMTAWLADRYAAA